MDRFRWYRTAAGGNPVQKVLDTKWLKAERAAMIELQQRYVQKKTLPRETERIGDSGLFALRTSLNGVALRLYFGRCGKDGSECVVVHALRKKTDAIPQKDLERAKKRLQDWNSRESGLPPGKMTGGRRRK